MKFEVIKRDDEFWKKKMESQLKNFYFDSLLPQLILINETLASEVFF